MRARTSSLNSPILRLAMVALLASDSASWQRRFETPSPSPKRRSFVTSFVSFARGPERPANVSPKDRYDSLLRWYSEKYRLPFDTFKAQMIQESAANPTAVSRVGACGLMQFMPATWEDRAPNKDRCNPEHSIEEGARYMRDLLDSLDGDYAAALAAYNWGIGRVKRAMERLGESWRAALPAETSKYLHKILGDV